MKKTKLALIAVALIAICSAFATTKPSTLTTVYGRYDNQWIAVDPLDEDVTFRCDPGQNYCLYEDQSFDYPIGTQNKTFVPLAR